MAQFYTKLANVFFVCVAILESIPAISISGGKPVTLMPLTFVLLGSMLKDGLEDCARHQSDDTENKKKVHIYNKTTGQFVEGHAKDI